LKQESQRNVCTKKKGRGRENHIEGRKIVGELLGNQMNPCPKEWMFRGNDIL